jgi:hypothetical protein
MNTIITPIGTINIAAYRAANPEKVKASLAKYRAANLERIKARDAAYCAANREKINARQRVYRAAKKILEAIPAGVKAQWASFISRFALFCNYRFYKARKSHAFTCINEVEDISVHCTLEVFVHVISKSRRFPVFT